MSSVRKITNYSVRVNYRVQLCCWFRDVALRKRQEAEMEAAQTKTLSLGVKRIDGTNNDCTEVMELNTKTQGQRFSVGFHQVCTYCICYFGSFFHADLPLRAVVSWSLSLGDTDFQFPPEIQWGLAKPLHNVEMLFIQYTRSFVATGDVRSRLLRSLSCWKIQTVTTQQ